ncbi:hypothetical protein OKW43_007469 [Paraburkholderia sp. WC7.3g]
MPLCGCLARSQSDTGMQEGDAGTDAGPIRKPAGDGAAIGGKACDMPAAHVAAVYLLFIAGGQG